MPRPRSEALRELESLIPAAVASIEIFETPAYIRSLSALREAGMGEALQYLEAVKQALARKVPLLVEFRDHVLKRPPLKGFRSVIVGEIEGTDITVILVYKRAGSVTDLYLVEEHNAAYQAMTEFLG